MTHIAAAAAILALAVACTPASDQPTAEDALCDSLAAFNDSVQAIADLDPQSDSVEDVQAAAQAAAADVAEADDAAVGAAWSDLSQTITDLPSDVPIADNWETVQAGIDDVQGVYGEMRDGLGCDA
jgi:hypothetical protein